MCDIGLSGVKRLSVNFEAALVRPFYGLILGAMPWSFCPMHQDRHLLWNQSWFARRWRPLSTSPIGFGMVLPRGFSLVCAEGFIRPGACRGGLFRCFDAM